MRLVVSLLLALSAAGSAAQAELAVKLEASAVVAGSAARGFSGVNLRFDDTYWVLADPGHTAPRQPADAPVVFHHLYIDWLRGTGRILDTQTLHDGTHGLTRADLNVDAMQVLGNSVWLADDSGPWLVETDLHGRILGKYAALVDGLAVTSAEVRRGFGGLAASRDRRLLYAAFEGALWRDTGREAAADGREFSRVLEFDVATRRWTGRSLRYALEANGNTIADLRFVDARTALVVERGVAFCRIYRVLLAGDELAKAAYVDLRFLKLPAVEGIEIIEPGYLVLTSGERRELVLLRAPDLLFPAFERSRP